MVMSVFCGSYSSFQFSVLCFLFCYRFCLVSNIVFGSWRDVLDTTLCDKVCQWPAVGGFPPGTPVSSTNKTDRHDITEILLKVALNTIALNLYSQTMLRCSKVEVIATKIPGSSSRTAWPLRKMDMFHFTKIFFLSYITYDLYVT